MPDEELLAIDLAILPPEGVNQRAQAINSTLWANRTDGFRFDSTHLPHITLVQQFVRRENLARLIEVVTQALSGVRPLQLRVTGLGTDGSTLLLLIEPAPELWFLHGRLMDAVRPVEESAGTAEAFYAVGEAARDADAQWVAEYRTHAAYARFVPHITLGVGTAAEPLEPFEFTANRVALCHLGRFCTCRVILREWTLGAES